jgi:formate--tetrahydrofolate ligase
MSGDDEAEIAVVRERCEQLGLPFAVSDHVERGGEGGEDLARLLTEVVREPDGGYRPLYRWEDPVLDKIRAVAQRIYGARDVALTSAAERDLEEADRLGYSKLPVCMAKTQYSLTDDPSRKGRPNGFDLTVRGIQINAGAGFLVVLTGDILRMPGLPRHPRAASMDVVNGRIVGVA